MTEPPTPPPTESPPPQKEAKPERSSLWSADKKQDEGTEEAALSSDVFTTAARSGATIHIHVKNIGAFLAGGDVRGNVNAQQAGGARSHEASQSDANWPEEMFDVCADCPADLAYLAALSVLHDAPTALIEDAASMLEAALPEPSKEPAPRRASARSALHRRARVTTYAGRGVAVPVERSRFTEDSDWKTALAFVWSEFRGSPGWRTLIEGWLCDLAEHDDVEVRLLVGRSVAALGAHRFESVDSSILEKWRRSPSVRPLDALDIAYIGFSQDANVRKVICKRIEAWAHGEAGRDGYYAAGAIAGGLFGSTDQELALRIAQSLFSHHHATPARCAAHAYVGIIASAAADSRKQVIKRTLETVSAHHMGERNPRAELFQDFIAVALVAAEIVEDRDKVPEHRPIIATISDNAPEVLPVCARMYNRALYRDRGRRGAILATERLISSASRRADIAPQVWAFLRTLVDVAEPNERDLLGHFMPGWIEAAARKGGSNLSGARAAMSTLVGGEGS